MKITDKVNLFYPNEEKQRYAHERRKRLSSYPNDYIRDLETKRIALMLLPQNPDKVFGLFLELNDDIQTLNYRLDCLDDFIRQPKLSDTFRKIIRRLSDNNSQIDTHASTPNSFMELKERMDELRIFLDCITEINGFYNHFGKSLKSAAITELFAFFSALIETDEFKTIENDLTELESIFSKTIRSVKIGINFTSDMTPEACGILEVSNDKIYPKGNIFDRLIFKTYAHSDQFIGDEHTNSSVKNQPSDMDTALFKELDRYTKDFTKRISNALKNYREIFFTDINELEHQLDFYDGAANLISYVESRGLKMCRPDFLPKSERTLEIKNGFDLCFFRQASNADYKKFGDDLIVRNDIDMSDEKFYLVTGANNGGKTTFARAVGTCQLLAQIGCYVPAESAVISPADFIFTHFPKEEEIGIDSSRFTTEMKQLKEICDLITPESIVIMNESIQSTTPDECLEIAVKHLEIMACAGVKGMFVTHLNGLYDSSLKINEKGYRSKIGSIVSVTNESGKIQYKFKKRPPLNESRANAIYDKFGARLEDIIERLGVK